VIPFNTNESDEEEDFETADIDEKKVAIIEQKYDSKVNEKLIIIISKI
tara:strand:- start:435 stop:578 length:144 start_codon:yes stop_codon:yes gene_type:complete